MARRIRVFFINCPTLATEAAAHLLLAQNSVQKTLQFELHHFWIFGQLGKGPISGIWDRMLGQQEEKGLFFRRWAERKRRTRNELRAAPQFREPLPRKGWSDIARAAIADYDTWFLKSGYNTFDFQQSPAVIVTETPFEGGFISFSESDIAVVSLSKWREFFAPGSALEYVLISIQRVSLRLATGGRIGSHYATRGCIWDFANHQPDSRFGAFIGLLCESCRESLRSVLSDQEFEEVTKLAENKWLGTPEITDSVAGVLARNYRYDLSRYNGLHPSLASVMRQALGPEIVKGIGDVAKWVAIFLLTVLIASCFPSIANFLKN